LCVWQAHEQPRPQGGSGTSASACSPLIELLACNARCGFIDGRTFGCGIFVFPNLLFWDPCFACAQPTAPFDLGSKTVDEVIAHVERALPQIEDEPEYVSQGNIVDDANGDLYGMLGIAPWPEWAPRSA
jgi:hypothetical protein